MRRIVTLGITVLFVFCTSSVFASNDAPSNVKACLTRTLSAEWEFDADTVSKFEIDNKVVKFFYSSRIWEETLSNSHFRNLFSFHGKNKKNQWIENLIPKRVVETKIFQALAQKHPTKFYTKKDQTFIQNWKHFEQSEFVEILRRLIEARGKHQTDLKIRKIAENWKDKNTQLDQFIPDEVAEEWKGETSFGGIEFPMRGYTAEAKDLRDYFKHLWIRLGFLNENDQNFKKVLKKAKGHVHWVPDVHSLPRNLRQRVYQAMIGFWGDSNDSVMLLQNSVYDEFVKVDGTVSVTQKDAEDIHTGLLGWLDQKSILELTRDTYKRLKATPEGVIVADRMKDLDTHVDTNFPPVFKRLFLGLRGIYGQPIIPDGVPIPIVGIEARNLPNMFENTKALPKAIKGTDEVDLVALLRHSTSEERGIISSIDKLKDKAVKLGIHPEFVNELIQSFDSWGLPIDKSLPKLLLPLNDWLNHPLVKRNLAAMSFQDQQKAVKKYQNALERYKSRMNDLTKARLDPSYRYQPDWDTPIEEFDDGINRVYPRKNYPRNKEVPGELLWDPQMWMQVIVSTELPRFISEAGLNRLMRMP